MAHEIKGIIENSSILLAIVGAAAEDNCIRRLVLLRKYFEARGMGCTS